MDLKALEANYQPMTFSKPQAAQKKPKLTGLKGLAANLLPTIGGTVGAIGGTLIAPVVGTAAGGATGSALGEALRQRLTGEQDLGKLGTEAALGSLPGVGKLLKGAKTAVKSSEALQKPVGDVAKSLTQKGRVSVERKAVIANGKKVAGLADETTPAVTTPANLSPAKQSLLSKIKTSAAEANQEGKGVVVGATKAGKVVTPKDADRVTEFINNGSKKYGGIRSGRPIDQAKDAQKVHNTVVSKLDDTLTKINRTTTPEERAGIISSISSKVAADAGITGKKEISANFSSKIEAAGGDLKKLEKIRREADDIAFKESGGKGSTAKAAEANHVRDAIDEFITPLSSDYKAIKSDYGVSKEALDATSKANKSAKGIKLPFTDVEVGKQALPGVKNKVSGVIAGAPQAAVEGAVTQPSMKKQAAKSLLGQVTSRAVAAPVMAGGQTDNSQSTNSMADPTMIDPTTNPSMTSVSPDAGADANPQQAALDQAIMTALASGDTKGLSNLLAVADYYEKRNPTAAKPLSAEASKTIANANSGLSSLQTLEGIISNGGVPKATLLPGRGVAGGIVGNVAGTGEYDTAARNIRDVITRLRSGAAITDQEMKFYSSQLPQAFDSPETVQEKLGIFRDLFNSVSNRTGTAGTDLSSLAGA
jgi:hypothetical protein